MHSSAFICSSSFISIYQHKNGRASNRCRVTAEYLPPSSVNVDFRQAFRAGNFGAVFIGQYVESDSSMSGEWLDIVVKCPKDSDMALKLYEMEKHANMKLKKRGVSGRRSPYFLGEIAISSDTPLALGMGRVGLVWEQSGSGETLEQYLTSARIVELASMFGTTASGTTLRRDLCATILRELAFIVQDVQSCGIVHRDIKPENLLVVPDNGEGAALQAIDFGSSCDWGNIMKKGLGLATCDPVYTAPERRLDIFKPAFRFDVYSVALIALRVALPSLTDAYAMNDFVNNVLSKGRFSLSQTCEAIASGRVFTSQAVSFDLAALTDPSNEDLYAVLATMLTEKPEDRADIKDCIRSRFLESAESYA